MTNKNKGAKKKKRQDSYRTVVLQQMGGKQYRPLTFKELVEKLSIIDEHSEEFQDLLDLLIRERKIDVKDTRYSLNSSSLPATLKGTIRMNPRGFGFVEVEGFEEDIFIPRHLTQNSMDGDQVEIAVSPIITEKGPEGKVLSITSRSRSHLTGIVLHASGHLANVYVPMLGKDQPVSLKLLPDQVVITGDRVVMEIEEWAKEETICILSRKLGHISDPSLDIPAAIAEFELRTEFSSEILEETKKLGKTVSQKTIQTREDLRELETFTIDPDTAKDFDDAISLSKDKEIYHLAVHIADVSHYVPAGSLLDKEAFLRSNSTYFPGKCIPMLPSELSDHLCSLKPNVNRLTVTVFMDFDATGEMLSYRLAKSVIKSQKRFTYKEARKVLDGKVKSLHKPALLLMQELCLLLKKKRYERGSVEFAMPELVVLVDEKGVPTNTDYVEYDITHQLVEEFMLKANETVAKHLDAIGKGVPFRVHDEPSEENMRDFAFLAGAFGFSLPPKPAPSDIQKMFDEALQTPFGQYLATSYIRRMRLAIYSPVNIGHYGLSLTHYCHFTSPIRRYVDLVAHRLIFDLALDINLLEKISDRCSERERISAKAENSVLTLKKYRLLEKYYQENKDRSYEAILTRIKPFGITFEILELMLEGFIHISEIGNDYYEFDEGVNRLQGTRRGEIYASGDRITVQLKELNLLTCESEWRIMLHDSKERPSKRSYSKKR